MGVGLNRHGGRAPAGADFFCFFFSKKQGLGGVWGNLPWGLEKAMGYAHPSGLGV